jgi:hypothetical protein
MADQVTIKPETNKVELTDQRRQISVTDNRTGTSINLTQTDPQVIQINTPGPQGSSGITPSGSFSGSFQGDGSGLTGVVASGSIQSASFAVTASFAETASYAVSASHEIIKEVSSSFADTASFAQSGDGIFSGSFSGSFEGDGSNLTGIATSTGSFTGSLTGSMLVSDHILPDTDEIYDLGSPEKKFRDLYLSGSSIYLGDKKVTIDDGTLKVFDSGTLDPAPAQLSGSFTGSFSGTASIAIIATTASIANIATTASIANIATTASYAETASIRYDSGSNTITGLDEIKINDFDDNVGVTFQDSKLTLTFGSPTVPSISSFFNSGFDTDRFNKVEDASTVTGNWSNGGYTFVSASILTGSIVLATTVEAGDTNITLAQTTSGSQSYTLIYTGSSPLDGSEYKLSSTVTSTLSKTNPTNPSISDTVTIQLGDASNQFEQGATGSIVFSSAYGNSNGWDQVSLVNTPANSPIEVTGSATGSTSISIQAVASYESPSGENDPQRTTSRTSTTTFSKIRSVRFGASAATSFTQAELEDLGVWDTTLGGDIGTIDKGNTNPSGDEITITWSGDKYQYIIYDGSRSDLTNISTGGFGVIGQFTKSTVGDYTVYRTTALQAGGGGTSITYNLT